MERFKFRVWDKENKKLYYGINVAICNTAQAISVLCKGNTRTFLFEDCTIQQCTGLKDKNGKLIYEGDVVGANKARYVVKRHNNGIYELHLLNVKECPKIIKCWVLEGYLKHIIKLGSIHENPELIERIEDGK